MPYKSKRLFMIPILQCITFMLVGRSASIRNRRIPSSDTHWAIGTNIGSMHSAAGCLGFLRRPIRLKHNAGFNEIRYQRLPLINQMN